MRLVHSTYLLDEAREAAEEAAALPLAPEAGALPEQSEVPARRHDEEDRRKVRPGSGDGSGDGSGGGSGGQGPSWGQRGQRRIRLRSRLEWDRPPPRVNSLWTL